MVVKKSSAGKQKASRSVKARVVLSRKKVIGDEGGVSLDDAFGDDEDVEYAPSKPRKEKKNKEDFEKPQSPLSNRFENPRRTSKLEGYSKLSKGMSEEELEEEIEEIETGNGVRPNEPKAPVSINASRPITSIKKGDRVQIDGKEYLVDAHDVLIDHGSTKEMAIELYDGADKDYQLRYFNDQVENTLELYELQEILYVRKQVKMISW